MRHLAHLAFRFFRSLRARMPAPTAQHLISDHLDEETLAEVFWRQPIPDLDHAIRGALWIAATTPDRPDLVRAFLLHDVGKRHARLGTWGRSFATAMSLLRLPVGARGRAYLDHAAVGEVELVALGVEDLVVAFARNHHGPCPPGVAATDWDVLVEADRR